MGLEGRSWGGRGGEGKRREGKRGKGRARGAFRQIRIYDYTPDNTNERMDGWFTFCGILSTKTAAISCLKQFKVY